MKKVLYILPLIGLFMFSLPSKGQVVDQYQADKEKLKIKELNQVTSLEIIEEVDQFRLPQSNVDSVGAVATSQSITIRKKVRLNPDELKRTIPEVVYEYPDGTLEVDYQSLVAILFIAYSEDQQEIKTLKEEIKELKGTLKQK